MIHAAVLAISQHLTVRQLAATWAPYLTMAEGLRLAAQTFDPRRRPAVVLRRLTNPAPVCAEERGPRAAGPSAGRGRGGPRRRVRGHPPPRPPGAGELAAATGLPAEPVRQALRRLVATGTATVDDDGRVTGVGGLSLTPTRHRLRLAASTCTPGARLTWSASRWRSGPTLAAAAASGLLLRRRARADPARCPPPSPAATTRRDAATPEADRPAQPGGARPDGTTPQSPAR